MNKTNIRLDKKIAKFKNSILYIDWNIYAYLSGISESSAKYQSKAKCFSTVLDNYFYRDKICLVFSDAHYRDIILGGGHLNTTMIKLIFYF